MFCELHFRLQIGGTDLSDHSRRMAERFKEKHKNEGISAEAALEGKKILDEGFQRLRDDLAAALRRQIDELNAEPEIGNILVGLFETKDWVIVRSDLGEKMEISFDRTLHKAQIKLDQPVKIREEIEVKLTPAHLWWYADKKEKPISVNELSVKLLEALLGI